jgi:hypothetical protein
MLMRPLCRTARGSAAGIAVLATVLWAAGPLPGQEVISPSEFERITEGRNVEYAHDGVVEGQEQHLPDRHVVWRYVNGECLFGRWTVRNGAICYNYEYSPYENCVTYYRQGDALMARDRGLDGKVNLYTLRILDGRPLPCPGG